MVTNKSILFFGIIFMIEITFVKCKFLSNAGQQEICETSACHETAIKLKKKMDFNVDPCDNFYKFVCGNFVKNANDPSDQKKVNLMVTIQNKLKRQIKELLEADILLDEPRAFQLTKTLYRNCLNTQDIEDEGLKPLKNILYLLGRWPLLKRNWNDETFDWKEFTYRSRKMGFIVDPLMVVLINTDMKNTSRRTIVINSPFFDVDQQSLMEGSENEAVQAYKKYIIDVVPLFDKSLTTDLIRISREVDEVINLKIQLANMSLTLEDRAKNTSLSYNPMTVAELSKLFPYVPWLEYLNKLMEPYQVIDETEIVNIADFNYFIFLGNLLQRVPKRVIANYAMWRVIFSSAAYLSENIREKQMEYLAQSERQPRDEECLTIVQDQMSVSVDAMFANKYFDKEDKNNLNDLVANIRAELRNTISKVHWMDNETRSLALQKLDQTNIIVGYPDEMMDNYNLDNYFSTLNIRTESLLSSIRELTHFYVDNNVKSLREPVSKDKWLTFSRVTEVDAFFWPIFSTIMIPAAILQDEFFNKERPSYMNYGAIGYTIGHELTHPFDVQGSQYDKDGNVVNWWKDETRAKFLDRVKCLVDQYGNYEDETTRIKVNGDRTQGENIADNGGIAQSYRAYQKWVVNHGEEAKLPGFQNYTSNQMFWISMANVWCTKYIPEFLSETLSSATYPPEEFRIVGTLRNQKDFAKDFKCSNTAYMNPVDKCVVW